MKESRTTPAELIAGALVLLVGGVIAAWLSTLMVRDIARNNCWPMCASEQCMYRWSAYISYCREEL